MSLHNFQNRIKAVILSCLSMSREQTIVLYQPMLQAIALKIVGSLHDAEDIVQDTFLKYLTIDASKVQNTKAYLIKSVTNNCLNHINSIKQKKKEYLDSIKLPEFIDRIDLSHLDIKQEFETAVTTLHKKLEPLERSIFILRECFDYEYDELQDIFDKKKNHCRQLFCRAKQKLSDSSSKLNINKDIFKGNLFDTFKNAFSKDQMDEFIDHLKSSH